jgi:predicted aminopeptidase
LREHLETARALRHFASAAMALPDNGSYRYYADLRRSYVVRNVFATPKLSLELRRWCFWVVGCVSYRGYYDADAAQQFADRLQEQGDDVYLADIPAYSTLGWFADPLLNTFIHWPAGRLAELLFHELAHQRLYIRNATDFNESFATAVGRLGARLWLARYATVQAQAAYETSLCRFETLLDLIATTREALSRLYAAPLSPAAKRVGKHRLLATLQADYRRLKRQWDGDAAYDAWFQQLNNAKLAALATYTRFVPAFEYLFAATGQDFPTFYQIVQDVGALPAAQREARLQGLLNKADANLAATACRMANDSAATVPVETATLPEERVIEHQSRRAIRRKLR